MRKYISFFRIRFSNTLQYRSAAWAGVCTQFAWGFMMLLMYKAFYETDPAAIPMPFDQLASYIWLQQGFLALFAFWFFDNDIFATIVDGGISYELLRPMSIYNMWMTKNFATRSAKALLRCFPVFIVAAVLPQPFRMGAPANPEAFVLFLVSLILGFIVVVSSCMLVYISTMHLMSYQGIKLLVASVAELLSGGIVPLNFFPDSVASVVELLPFASMNNVPFRIYSGNMYGQEMWRMIALQIFWIIALQLIGRLWMKNSLKNVVVQGG